MQDTDAWMQGWVHRLETLPEWQPVFGTTLMVIPDTRTACNVAHGGSDFSIMHAPEQLSAAAHLRRQRRQLGAGGLWEPLKTYNIHGTPMLMTSANMALPVGYVTISEDMAVSRHQNM